MPKRKQNNQNLNNWGLVFMVWAFIVFAVSLIILTLVTFEISPYDESLKASMMLTILGLVLASISVTFKVMYWRRSK